MQFSSDFFILVSVESNVVFVGTSREDTSGVQVEQSHAADIVACGILIENGEFEVELGGGSDRNGDGFIPHNFGVFVPLGQFGLVLGGGSLGADHSHSDVVFHFADDVVAFVEDGVGDRELHS